MRKEVLYMLITFLMCVIGFIMLFLVGPTVGWIVFTVVSLIIFVKSTEYYSE
jgi:uncharacterized membrane protein YbaN (DUF454 family)